MSLSPEAISVLKQVRDSNNECDLSNQSRILRFLMQQDLVGVAFDGNYGRVLSCWITPRGEEFLRQAGL